MLNTMVTVGTLNVRFQAGDGTACLHKASGYKREKPFDWEEDDTYLMANLDDIVTASFTDSADKLEVNDTTYMTVPLDPIVLEEGVNEILVTSNGKEYYLAVHVVRIVETTEDNSGGVVWDEDFEFLYFESQRFFAYMWSIICRTPAYEDDYGSIQIKGYTPDDDPDDCEPPKPSCDEGNCCGGH